MSNVGPLVLRAANTKADGFEEGDVPHEQVVASANGAVPLLWLALFEYEELDLRRIANDRGGVDVFAAATTCKSALARLTALRDMFPRQPISLRGAADVLAEAIEAQEHPMLCLLPAAAITERRPAGARAYVRQLFRLCDIWQAARERRQPWGQTATQLESISGGINGVLKGNDQHIACYALSGDLATQWLKHHGGGQDDGTSIADDFFIDEGQGAKDEQPDAVAVGDHGVIVGCFDGQFKLMDSGCGADLRAVWGDDRGVWAVGESGVVLTLVKGKWIRVPLSSEQRLNTVWMLDPQSVFVGGDGGKMFVGNSEGFRPWPMSGTSNIRCVWGDGPDNICVGADRSEVLRYDGYGWQRLPLSEDAFATAFNVVDGRLFTAASSPTGGKLLAFVDGAFKATPGLPHLDQLTSLWAGFGSEMGAVSASAECIRYDGSSWSSEALPLTDRAAANAGATTLAVGLRGEHGAIALRDGGDTAGRSPWRLIAALRGIKLNDVWVAGRPKPSRTPPPTETPEGPSAAGSGSTGAGGSTGSDASAAGKRGAA